MKNIFTALMATLALLGFLHTTSAKILISPAPLHTVGQITHHANNFAGQLVSLRGYMLAIKKNYAIFSDEPDGAISSFDLPVTGPGINTLTPKTIYQLQGKFIYGGLKASNHNLYHLELLEPLSEVSSSLTAKENSDHDPDDVPIPSIVPVSNNDLQQEPANQDALGGYNVLIADRGNNRLIEITPNKKIIWEYDFNLPKLGLGADDAFFTDNGKTVIVNLELYHLIQQIDYQTKKVVWSYGVPGQPGSAPGYLNRPDDAYKLPNKNVMSADIKNCRVIEISPDKKIVRQYGVTKVCNNNPGHLNKPNGDTPLPNGHVLISNIVSNSIIELDQNWKQILELKVPLKYPSDPQPMKDGNILISDYNNPGKIIEITRKGEVLWRYDVAKGLGKLNSPSLAIELPNGNILANDDLNHRIVVINKKTKEIVWQYGTTNKPGRQPGQLNIPDGVDIIKR